MMTVRSPEPFGTPTVLPIKSAASLAHCVGHDADEARALDGLCKLALLERRHGGNAARHDLAALGDVALQQAHVLVVDLGGVIARERAGFAAALEGAARLGGSQITNCHSSNLLALNQKRSGRRSPPIRS